MRLFLDFDNDESYTPTRIQFWAGMGSHDMQQFAEMTFEQPRGWIDVDFSNVGPVLHDEAKENQADAEIDWDSRPVLRAFLVQVRIIDNHQNGKDTHLRGLQIFARDLTATPPQPRLATNVTSIPLRSLSLAEGLGDQPLKKASWMLEPELR